MLHFIKFAQPFYQMALDFSPSINPLTQHWSSSVAIFLPLLCFSSGNARGRLVSDPKGKARVALTDLGLVT